MRGEYFERADSATPLRPDNVLRKTGNPSVSSTISAEPERGIRCAPVSPCRSPWQFPGIRHDLNLTATTSSSKRDLQTAASQLDEYLKSKHAGSLEKDPAIHDALSVVRRDSPMAGYPEWVPLGQKVFQKLVLPNETIWGQLP